jgi:hypothetical protein
MAWCLNKQFVQLFRKGLTSKEIDPNKLASMTSEERHAFLEKYVGKENALNVNSLFESKLLLKNQKAGYISWAKRAGGMNKETKKDLISRIERMDKVLSPEEEKAFLRDLAETKLGVRVTETEAKTISDLSTKVTETRSLQKPDLTFENEAQRLEYGRSQVNLMNYVNGLKEQARSGFSLNPIDIASTIGGNAKSIKASMDNSAIFRQGWKTLWTNPVIWAKNAVQSFKNIVKTFGGKPVMDELNADIISRPTYDLMKKAKLAVANITEEAFPGTIVEKLPILGRAYKSSEVAFTAFVQKTRADVFDKYIQIAQKSGVELTEKELQAIGSMVNSLTGRGNFGKYEGSAVNAVNNILFSPRYLKSQIDTVGHVLTGAGGSNFVRKQATINLVKVITGIAGVLATAEAIRSGSVEKDPRSTDFGKIRVGNTRFDVSGGMASLVTLASRLITMSSKSSTTGKVTPLNSGDFGAMTGKDVIYNFFENKLSPLLSVMKDLAQGEDFNGNKPTLGGELKNLFVPLSITTLDELMKDPNSANPVLAIIADVLGIATNTYGKTNKDWTQNPTKSQEAFLKKVGEDKFKTANEQFNKQYDDWFAKTAQTDTYKNLSDDGKQKLMNDKKEKLQEKIFKDYGFTYKTPPKSQEKKKEDSIIKKLLNFKLVKEAYAIDGEDEVQNKQREIALRYRKEHPEFYTEHIGEEGEIKLFGKTLGEWPIGLKQKAPPKEIKNQVMNVSKKYKVDPALISAMLWQESGYRPEAQNGDDRGIAQINKKAHPEVSDKQAYNREFAVNWMAREMASLIKHFDGDISRAVAAYNVGRGGANVRGPEKFGGGPNGQTYINNVSRNLTDEAIARLGLKTSEKLASK